MGARRWVALFFSLILTISIGAMSVASASTVIERRTIVKGGAVNVEESTVAMPSPTTDSPAGPANSQASARADGLEMRVRAGWNGMGRMGSWIPVVTEVINRGPDTRLEVEVVTFGEVPPQTPQAPAIGAFARRVSLARGARKEILQYVPVEGGMLSPRLEVRLVREGKTLAATPLKMNYQGQDMPVLGVLAEPPGNSGYLKKANINVRQQFGGWSRNPMIVELTVEQLPEFPPAWDNFDILLVDGVSPVGLSADQRQALARWVRQGGHLVLAAGPSRQQAYDFLPEELREGSGAPGVLERKLPALAKFVNRSLEADASFVLAPLDLPEGKALLRDGDVTVISQAALGNGRVTWLALDPLLEPLAGWQGRTAFIEKVMNPQVAMMEDKGVPWGAGMWGPCVGGPCGGPWGQIERFGYLGWTARWLPLNALPPVRTLALILIGFVLVVGPLNYLILRRFDKREWAWGTVPALVFLFVGGVYYGFIGQGRDLLANGVAILDLDPAAGVMRQDAYLALFAPSRQTMTLEVPAGIPVRPTMQGVPWGPWGPGSGPTPNSAKLMAVPIYRIVSGAATEIQFTEKTQYSIRTLWSSRETSLEERITTDLRVYGQTLRGTLTNGMGHRLEEAAVLLGDEFVRLGDLAPGETKAVALKLPKVVKPAFGPIGTKLYFPEGMKPTGPNQLPPPPPGPEKQRRMDIVNLAMDQLGMTQNGPWGQGVPAGFHTPGYTPPFRFIAFTRDRTAGLPVAGDSRFRHDLTLVTQPLALNLDRPGPFALPRGLVMPELLERKAKDLADNLPWSLGIDRGSAMLQFTLPLPAKARVERLTLYPDVWSAASNFGIKREAGKPKPLGLQDTTVQIYNWRTGRWDPLPGKKTIKFPAPADYISAGQEVRVRLQAPAGHPIFFRGPTLKVEGRVDG